MQHVPLRQHPLGAMWEETAAWTSARLRTGKRHSPLGCSSLVLAQLDPKVLVHTSWLPRRSLQRLVYQGTHSVLTFLFYGPG